MKALLLTGILSAGWLQLVVVGNKIWLLVAQLRREKTIDSPASLQRFKRMVRRAIGYRWAWKLFAVFALGLYVWGLIQGALGASDALYVIVPNALVLISLLLERHARRLEVIPELQSEYEEVCRVWASGASAAEIPAGGLELAPEEGEMGALSASSATGVVEGTADTGLPEDTGGPGLPERTVGTGLRLGEWLAAVAFGLLFTSSVVAFGAVRLGRGYVVESAFRVERMLRESARSVEGVVTHGGAPAPGVRVTLATDLDVLYATSGSDGRFEFESVRGAVMVQAEANGAFATARITDDGAPVQLALEAPPSWMKEARNDD